jgi:tRNA (guanine37-N1)-methyltransferase
VVAVGKVAVVMPDPTGPLFGQEDAQELSRFDQVVFLCGHYEGIDERVCEKWVTHRFSIGDYVLTGGELPALVMADAVVRLLPGVLGDASSLGIDSHSDGLLSAPQYTRPEVWEGRSVPDVLRSGDHGAIAKWKRAVGLKVTRERRPDLFARAALAKSDLVLLEFGTADKRELVVPEEIDRQ